MKRKHRKNDTENEDEEEAADQNTVKESSDLTEAAATTAGNGENDSENEDGNDSDVEQGLDIINEDITETSQTKMNKMSIAALGMQKVIIAKQEHLNEISVSNDKLVQENRMIAKELLSTGEEEEKGEEDYEAKVKMLHELEDEIEDLEQNNSIIRHVLECLITESNVNWVEDNEIREFILGEQHQQQDK